jgi:hypothetical protein
MYHPAVRRLDRCIDRQRGSKAKSLLTNPSSIGFCDRSCGSTPLECAETRTSLRRIPRTDGDNRRGHTGVCSLGNVLCDLSRVADTKGSATLREWVGNVLNTKMAFKSDFKREDSPVGVISPEPK